MFSDTRPLLDGRQILTHFLDDRANVIGKTHTGMQKDRRWFVLPCSIEIFGFGMMSLEIFCTDRYVRSPL